MRSILNLSLRQLSGRWRLLLITLLAALPVALGSIVSALSGDDAESGRDFINVIIDGMIISATMPVVMMVLATAAFGHELDDRTLSYLVLKPVPRSMIVLPKILASVIIGGSLMTVSVIVAVLLGPEGSGQAAVAAGVGLLIGIITYATIFTWAGLMSSRALGFALIYVFLWEAIVTSILGGARYLSVRGYILAIIHGIDGDGFAAFHARAIEFPAGLIGAAVMTGLFFWLTVRRLRRMDVP